MQDRSIYPNHSLMFIIINIVQKMQKHEQNTKETRKIHVKALYFSCFVVYYKRGDYNDAERVTHIEGHESS